MKHFYVSGKDNFKIKANLNERQTIFLFGNSNGNPICGVLLVLPKSNSVKWAGTGSLTTTYSDQLVNVVLPSVAWDVFTFFSADPFEVIIY